MKKTLFYLVVMVIATVTLSSCHSSYGGAFGAATDIDPYTRINSYNEYDLIIADQGIEYTIDYSTPDGRMKLRKLTLDQAKELVNAEAAIKYNCAMIVRPKYTFLKDGKQILRITVFGFPANYKNASKDNNYVPEQNRQRVDINVNR